MKLLYRLIVLVVFVFCMVCSSSAQTSIKSFTPDSVKFLEEVTQFLQGVRKKEGKVFIKEFTLFWYGGKYSERERELIYSTCNFMLKKRIPAFPEFKSYLFSVMSFAKSDQSSESFEAWQESVEKLISGKSKRQFVDYLRFCNSLFEDKAVYSSSTTKWVSSSSDYQFDFFNVPVIIFKDIDLKCYSKKDSAVIYNTSGIYYPNEKKWVGKGGNVYWDRCDFKRDQVYAELGDYKIKVKSPTYSADSVIFHNTNYFDAPLKGKLTEKVLANVTAARASYPRFDSYSKRLRIKDLVEKVDFEGGFNQHGGKFIGAGNEEEDAFIYINRDNKRFFTAKAKSFSIRPDRITSEGAKVKFQLSETDSISHPGLRFQFKTKERKMALVRTDKGVSRSPYSNTFHELDMYVEAVYWKIDDPLVELKYLEGSSEKKGFFSSVNFYKQHKYDRLQGMDRVHPLIAIKSCAQANETRELWVEEVAKCMKLPKTEIMPSLMKLSIMGYISYDFENHRIVVKDKLYYFVNSRAAKNDYDVLEISSVVPDGPNGKLNLLNYDLTVHGVKRVFLSDSQKVYVYPSERTITIKKNRDFDFGGIVNAGNTEFFGNNFSFKYDSFTIDMPKVDSMRIWADTPKLDEEGRKLDRRVTSVVENAKGLLELDLPNNKSGLEPAEHLPAFTCTEKSYVYYQKANISFGVYKRDKFYFELEPFRFDSLNSFANKDVKFAGTFVSDGIFPDFEEDLIIMPDYSLGFVRPTPPEGMKMYGGKGVFKDDIKMSASGLMGDGRLKYITSTTQSKGFHFYPDSVRAMADKYNVEEQFTDPQFPPVSATNVDVFWSPFKDKMKVTTIKDPFLFYDGNSKMTGNLTLKPVGLTGKGLFKFDEAELEADLFKFKFSEFESDTADFRLQALGASGLAFSTNNVKAKIDFQKRKGEFHSNGGGSFIEFPVNQYICYMEKFTWFMDKEEIELGADKVAKAKGQDDVQLEGSQFISVHPEQDSLAFYSPAALYDLRANKITAKKVKFIPVADALIYPDSGRVVIQKKAKMEPLENSKIVANSITKHHTLYEGNTNIFAKKSYVSSAKYDYIDENDAIQTLYFNNIEVDSTFQTTASGDIPVDEAFTLSPAFDYYGQVLLRANDPFLNFHGFTRTKLNCEQVTNAWFKFESQIDPEEIYIPVDSVLVNEEDKTLGAGLMMGADSAAMYSTFLSLPKKKNDRQIITSKGFLVFDKGANEYKISNLQKLTEISLPGNYLSINNNNCMLYGEGIMDLGMDLGHIKVTPVGKMTHNLVNGQADFSLMLLLDFLFHDNSLEMIPKYIKDTEGLGLETPKFERPVYERGLRELLGKEAADKLIGNVAVFGQFKKFPAELNKPMFLTDVRMKWNQKTQSYKSYGKIGVGNIYKKQVNKYLIGRLEFKKKKNGDIMHLYLEIDDQTWYYFYYQRNILQVVSSVDKFNTSIKELKADKRKIKYAKGQTFSFIMGSSRKKNNFIKAFDKK